MTRSVVNALINFWESFADDWWGLSFEPLLYVNLVIYDTLAAVPLPISVAVIYGNFPNCKGTKRSLCMLSCFELHGRVNV